MLAVQIFFHFPEETETRPCTGWSNNYAPTSWGHHLRIQNCHILFGAQGSRWVTLVYKLQQTTDSLIRLVLKEWHQKKSRYNCVEPPCKEIAFTVFPIS